MWTLLQIGKNVSDDAQNIWLKSSKLPEKEVTVRVVDNKVVKADGV